MLEKVRMGWGRGWMRKCKQQQGTVSEETPAMDQRLTSKMEWSLQEDKSKQEQEETWLGPIWVRIQICGCYTKGQNNGVSNKIDFFSFLTFFF